MSGATGGLRGAGCGAAWLLAACLAAGCDDSGERRTRAIQESRSADTAVAEQGAMALEKILEKTPNDALALYNLGRYRQRTGRTVEARHLFERLVATTPDSDEVEVARGEIARLAGEEAARQPPPPAPPASSAAPPPPLAAVPILPGKGAGKDLLGRPLAAAEKEPPPDRQSDEAGAVHFYWYSRGYDALYVKGKLARIGFYREGREDVRSEGTRTFTSRYRGFVGSTPEGVAVGQPEADAIARLGPPEARRRPHAPVVGKDDAITVELLDYPKKGLTLEIDTSKQGRVVGAIQIPTVEGRPLAQGPASKP
jgi:hypothetical protein